MRSVLRMPVFWFSKSIFFQSLGMHSPWLTFPNTFLGSSVHFAWSRTHVLDHPVLDFLVSMLGLPFKSNQTLKITKSKETDHQLITRPGTSCQILGFQDLNLLKSQTWHLIGMSVEVIIPTVNEFVKVFKVHWKARPNIQKIFWLANTQGPKGNF